MKEENKTKRILMKLVVLAYECILKYSCLIVKLYQRNYV